MYKDKKGLSLILVMIIIAVSTLLLRIAIEQIVKFNMAQNESNASTNLKLIATALENYAKDSQGFYPAKLVNLVESKAPYLNKNYFSRSSLKGYSYSCMRLEPSSYSCSATPIKCRLSGEKSFTVTTGGILTSEDCRKQE
jgi:Tfp pilus assembly protein PilE